MNNFVAKCTVLIDFFGSQNFSFRISLYFLSLYGNSLILTRKKLDFRRAVT